jgi:hypothetical protein
LGAFIDSEKSWTVETPKLLIFKELERATEVEPATSSLGIFFGKDNILFQ